MDSPTSETPYPLAQSSLELLSKTQIPESSATHHQNLEDDLDRLEEALINRVLELSQAQKIRSCYSKANELKMKYRKMIPNLKLKSTSQCCTICQENFIIDEVIKKLPCKHIMHRQCAKQWLKVNKSCPVCRLDLEKHYSQQEKNEKTKKVENVGNVVNVGKNKNVICE